MKIGVPSGIGDISWLVSKLVNSKEWEGLEVEVADGWPYRAKPYMDMLGVKSIYGTFKYEDILTFEKMNPYKEWRDISESGYGRFLMQPNEHLERGWRLEEYLPDLPTNFHYHLNIPEKVSPSLAPFIEKLSSDKYVGVSCASYRGAHAWHTWELDQWAALGLRLIGGGYGVCLLGGRWDDLTDGLGSELPDGSYINLVGKTDFSEACAIHKLLPFYVGFSSGLGIIRTVMGLPTLMLWPEHQQPLSMSWADPEDLASKKYVASPYTTEKLVYNLFKQQELTWGGKNG